MSYLSSIAIYYTTTSLLFPKLFRHIRRSPIRTWVIATYISMTELVAKTYFTDSDTTKMVPGRGLTDTNASIGVTHYDYINLNP